MAEAVVIATWPFGQTATKAALALLAAGGSALDAAVAGAQAVEDDPTVSSVGYGGLADSSGTVTLDACVMDGETLSCGGVACVENVRHVAALARRVMEKTPHLLLAGEGARLFAVQQGFALSCLHTPESVAEWRKSRPVRDGTSADSGDLAPRGTFPSDETHDTVTVLVLDGNRRLAGACTTSGLAHKLPGRVGDSPLVGAGLYVDGTAGAAGGTGVGEEILRVGGSLLIAEAMRAGKSPQEACELAVRRVNAAAVRRGVPVARVAFIALDPGGRTGAACTLGARFAYALGRAGGTELLQGKEIAP